MTTGSAPDPNERWIRLERRLDAPRERVHRAWSDPDELAAWFPRHVEGSLTVGTRTTLTWHDRRIPIDVLASDPPTLFRFRWAWPTQDAYQTTVSVTFEPEGYGTLVTLTDGPFHIDRPGVLDAYAEALEGWGEALSNLRAVVDYSVDLRHRRR
jgi:uncharacterized protein YndB with AHSA1/START domain